MWGKTEDRKAKSSSEPSSSLAASASSESPNALASVGQGIKIKGELSGRADFFMDGAFEGKIQIADGTVTLGPNARVNADIEAREIIIRGEVIGTLKAHERIQIASTGKVTADMDTRGIMIEDGAVLHGKVATPQALPKKDEALEPPPPGAEAAPRAKGAAAAAASDSKSQEQ